MTGLTANRCTACGRISFPRHARCPTCKGPAFVPVSLNEGRVVTFTRLTVTRPGFSSPLTLAIVEFPGGVRAIGKLAGQGGRVGMAVKVEVHDDEGRDGIAVVEFLPLPP